MNYYEVLDVQAGASAEELRRAYREQVEIHHPDRMQGMREAVRERAAARLALINEAYAALRDPATRAEYDVALRVGRARTVRQGRAGRGEPISRLRERLATMDAEIEAAECEISELRGREDRRATLDARWERYSFAALGLVWPYGIVAVWMSGVWYGGILTPATEVAMGLLLVVGYAALLLTMTVSGLRPDEVGYHRLLLGAPIALGIGLVIRLIGFSRVTQIVFLLIGYAWMIWTLVGRSVANQRTDAHVRYSRLQRLEEELYDRRLERQQLQGELARR